MGTVARGRSRFATGAAFFKEHAQATPPNPAERVAPAMCRAASGGSCASSATPFANANGIGPERTAVRRSGVSCGPTAGVVGTVHWRRRWLSWLSANFFIRPPESAVSGDLAAIRPVLVQFAYERRAGAVDPNALKNHADRRRIETLK